MSKTLLVVDVQAGFINDFTHHIPQRIARLVERENYTFVLFTQFVNSPEGPYTRLLNWQGCQDDSDTELAAELKSFADANLVFTKPGLCGLPEALINFLNEHQIQQVFVAGIDTDMCVLKIAMDLFDRSIEPIVLTDCCASTAGLQAHLAGLAVLSRNIGAQRLWEAGLGDRTLAAPAQ
jgi:nicotinamidase-related amidase